MKEQLPVAVVLGTPRQRVLVWWTRVRRIPKHLAIGMKYIACGMAILPMILFIPLSVGYAVDTYLTSRASAADCSRVFVNAADITDLVLAVVNDDPSRDLKTLEDRYGEVIVTCLRAEVQKTIGTEQ